MAARRYEISLRVLKNLSRVSAANTGLINARNKTRHVSFKDSRNKLYDPLIAAKR